MSQETDRIKELLKQQDRMDAELNEKMKRVALHALWASLAAGAVALAGSLNVADFGQWTPVAQAVASVLIKIGTVLVGI